MGGRLEDLDDWLEQYRRFWEDGFDRLDDHLRGLRARDEERGLAKEGPPETD